MLGRVCDLYELELEHRLDMLAGMAEPLIMAVMGAIVGFTVIGTVMPLMKVLESL